MSAEWLTLILLALVAGFLPWQFSAEVMILRKERGLSRATAFAGGITLWRFLLGILLAFVFAGGLVILRNGFGAVAEFVGSGFEVGVELIQNRQGPVLDSLLILSGIMIVIRAIRIWTGEPDPDAPPPKILATLDSIGARAAFGFGLAWVAISANQWIFLMAGVHQILGLQGGLAVKLSAFVLFVAVASLLIMAPIVYYAVRPARAQSQLAAVEEKLSTGMRYLGAFRPAGIGLFLTWRGLIHLIA